MAIAKQGLEILVMNKEEKEMRRNVSVVKHFVRPSASADGMGAAVQTDQGRSLSQVDFPKSTYPEPASFDSPVTKGNPSTDRQ